MDDVGIKFQGFHPSKFTSSYLRDKLSALREESPYGAVLQANRFKHEKINDQINYNNQNKEENYENESVA